LKLPRGVVAAPMEVPASPSGAPPPDPGAPAAPPPIDAVVQAVLDAGHALVVAVDRRGRVVFANRAVERATGRAAGELVGRPWRQVLAVDPRYPSPWNDASGPVAYEHAIRGRGGEDRLVAWHTTAWHHAGALAGTVSVGIDVTEQRRAEADLRRSEALLAEAERTARVGSWEWDLRSGAMAWSGEMFRIHGLAPRAGPPTPEEAWSYVHPEDAVRVRKAFAESRAGGNPAEVEYRVVRADGAVRILAARAVPTLGPDGAAVRLAGSCQDITERRRAEGHSVHILESAPDAMLLVREDGTITLANEQAERLFGYARSELVGQPVESLVPAGVRGRHAAHRAAYNAGPERRPMGVGLELRAVRKDGGEVPVEISLSPISTDEGTVVVAAVRDISERRRAEERVRFLHSVPLAMAEAPTVHVALAAALRTVCEATGWSLGEAWLAAPGERLGWALAWHRGEPALEGFVRASSGFALPSGEGLPGEAWARRHPVWVSDLRAAPGFQRQRAAGEAGLRAAVAVPVLAGGGPGEAHVLAVLVFFLAHSRPEDARSVADVAAVAAQVGTVLQRLQAGEELRRRTAELEGANRELEAFSYSVSHDLRAPLQTIDGFSHILLERHAAAIDAEGQHLLRRLRGAARDMGDLLDALLQLSRLARRPLTRETVDLTRAAGEVLARLQAADPRRRVEVEVQGGLAADADPAMVRILLENLLGNAWKFTSRREVARIAFTGRQEDGRTVFSVRDNGAGFDMAHGGKLFAPFQRLHGREEFEGTGIGLASVGRIVSRHGGQVWAEAAPDRGATFHFTLG
jgi:PAS domain S-box-containing protein